jgi:hypothetical protein
LEANFFLVDAVDMVEKSSQSHVILLYGSRPTTVIVEEKESLVSIEEAPGLG